jgi:GAF domain-containing protein
MRLLTSEVRYFSAADINFAMAVAEQGGIAIQNAVNYQKMQDILSNKPGSSTGGSI